MNICLPYPEIKFVWERGMPLYDTWQSLRNLSTIISNKLRKHIATIIQLLSLTQEESKQFCALMGYVQKTQK